MNADEIKLIADELLRSCLLHRALFKSINVHSSVRVEEKEDPLRDYLTKYILKRCGARDTCDEVSLKILRSAIGATLGCSAIARRSSLIR